MDECLANAIRRYVNQISILAINEVEISKNDSPLYDETIAHRIGLIPLKTEGSNNAKFELNAKGECFVFSKELKGTSKIIYDEMPITFLKKGGKLTLVATTKLGKGVEHSKFSPGIIFYRNMVKIEIDKNCPKEVISTCPKKILELKENKVIVKDCEKCYSCDACVEFCKKQNKDVIKIIPTNELLITIESFGQIDIKDIFKKSVEILIKDLSKIEKKIK
jgi:DNA-directed RNA polymerase subunit D